MIKGLGIDLIEIERIEQAHSEHGDAFLKRLFTEKEQQYCLKQTNPYPRFAGRFAAKEAIAKALGFGFGEQVSWKDIEILPDPEGKPIAHFSEKLSKRFGNPQILVSISHAKSSATAIAIWQE